MNRNQILEVTVQWIAELLSLGGCLVTFCLMVALLAHNDGHRPSEWYGLSLNTAISVLSVALKAWILYSNSQCIGQWKWILFHRSERRLIEFERIDLASRGPLGSVDILVRKETPWALKVGVLVTVLTMALDPFSQQLVQLQSGLENLDPWAAAARSLTYTGGFFSCKTGDSPSTARCTAQATINMQAAIINGLSRTVVQVQQDNTVVCPLGNCTYPLFDTLGVCHRCNDVLSDLRLVEDFGEFFAKLEQYSTGDGAVSALDASAWALPNGHFLPNLNDCKLTWSKGRPVGCENSAGEPAIRFGMTSFGTGDPNKTVSMQDVETLIWSMSFIHANISLDDAETDNVQWPNQSMVARECGLYYCVKTIEVTFEDGAIIEKSTEAANITLNSTSWKPSVADGRSKAHPAPPSMEFHDQHAIIQRHPVTFANPDDPTGTEYRLPPESVYPISAFFQTTLRHDHAFNTSISAVVQDKIGLDLVGFNGHVAGGADGSDSIVEPESLAMLFSEDEVPGSGGTRRCDVSLVSVFESMATSMTNEFRMMSTYRTGDTLPVNGTIYVEVTVYKVAWPWIALHSVILLNGVAFCLLTIFLSSNLHGRTSGETTPILKGSTLAVLSRGSMAQKILGGARTTAQLDARAKKGFVHMRLGFDVESGWSIAEAGRSGTDLSDVSVASTGDEQVNKVGIPVEVVESTAIETPSREGDGEI